MRKHKNDNGLKHGNRSIRDQQGSLEKGARRRKFLAGLHLATARRLLRIPVVDEPELAEA